MHTSSPDPSLILGPSLCSNPKPINGHPGGDQFLGLCDVTSDTTLLRLVGVKELAQSDASKRLLLDSRTIQIKSGEHRELKRAMFDPAFKPLSCFVVCVLV